LENESQDPSAYSNLTDLNAEIVACRKCPRLVAHRERMAQEKRRAYRDWDYWGRPVPGFGDPQARIVLIGLAPGAHGSNRTGRMFTGDASGEFLYSALYRAGYANQPSVQHAYDGLQLRDVFITAICRCAPPDNKPTLQEQANCLPYLASEFALLNQVRIVIALGRIALDGYLRLLREQGHAPPRITFGHGARFVLGNSLPTLICSYHPSRQNTQTGRLTSAMMDGIFERTKMELNR
jgi:uracil-DNA glycosylase